MTALPDLLDALFFFFNDTATTEIYTLSLHDALPIYLVKGETLGCPRHHLVQTHRAFWGDRKSTRLNSSHHFISYAVFCLKKEASRHRCNESMRRRRGRLPSPAAPALRFVSMDHTMTVFFFNKPGSPKTSPFPPPRAFPT